MSRLTQVQLRLEDEQAMQKQTSEESFERLQESLILVDKLRELDDLKRRLREVKDLEDRLTDMNEMAERLQGAIEEELGREEAEKLIREENDVEQEEQIQVRGITVSKKSFRTTETKEEDVDELEDQIKQVFLKGLSPEEEGAEIKREMEIEVASESLSDDTLRGKLHQIKKEWQEKVEEKLKSGFSDVTSTTSVVAYQVVEGRTGKRVPIVDEGVLTQAEVEDAQRGVALEKTVEEEATWIKTETPEAITEEEVTERLQAEDRSPAADKDIWFILFECPPYKAVFKPPGTVCENANLYTFAMKMFNFFDDQLWTWLTQLRIPPPTKLGPRFFCSELSARLLPGVQRFCVFIVTA